MYICTISVLIADLAERFCFTLMHYEDDGLGSASSMFVKLDSGRVALLTEHAHAVERLGAKGPSVEVDARDVVEFGVAACVDEVLDGFRLSREDVDWITPNDEAYARNWVRHWADYFAKRDQAGNGEPLK